MSPNAKIFVGVLVGFIVAFYFAQFSINRDYGKSLIALCERTKALEGKI